MGKASRKILLALLGLAVAAMASKIEEEKMRDQIREEVRNELAAQSKKEES
jgi:hypothetical protein